MVESILLHQSLSLPNPIRTGFLTGPELLRSFRTQNRRFCYSSRVIWRSAAEMSMSQNFTLGYAALVGVGGLMGYMKTGSTKSLTAGGISAAVLGYVYTALPTNPTFASAIGLGISTALLGVMGSRFKKSGKVFPAGVVSAMSLVMTAGYLHGIMRSFSH